MAYTIKSFNITDNRGAKLAAEFAARVATEGFPATKTKPDNSITPTTVEDYVERVLVNPAIDSWIDRDGDVTVASLKDKLKLATTTQLNQIKVILG